MIDSVLLAVIMVVFVGKDVMVLKLVVEVVSVLGAGIMVVSVVKDETVLKLVVKVVLVLVAGIMVVSVVKDEMVLKWLEVAALLLVAVIIVVFVAKIVVALNVLGEKRLVTVLGIEIVEACVLFVSWLCVVIFVNVVAGDVVVLETPLVTGISGNKKVFFDYLVLKYCLFARTLINQINILYHHPV